MVGNKVKIQRSGICKEVSITLQGHDFTILFYLLPIKRVNVVIGMQWLRTLGTVTANFAVPQITFSHLQKSITLHGDAKQLPYLSTFAQL